MKLLELFDDPLPYEKEYVPRKRYSMDFEAPNGIQYEVDAFKQRDSDGNEHWLLAFGAVDQKGDTDYGVTGTREEIPVFSTILAGIREFLQLEDPEKIKFTGQGASRQSLYKRLANMLVKQGNWDMEQRGENFTITRK